MVCHLEKRIIIIYYSNFGEIMKAHSILSPRKMEGLTWRAEGYQPQVPSY